jgi:hypothetical protein
MAKLVQMQTTAANPDHVLEAGKVYNLHDTLAAEYVRAGAAVYVDKEQLPPKTKILKKPRQPDPNDPHAGKPAPTIIPKKDEEDDGDVEEIVGGDDEPTKPSRRGPKVPKPEDIKDKTAGATGTTADPQAKPK